MKSILVTVLSLFSFLSFSQLTLKKLDGTVINNGDVLTFNHTEDPGNYLGLKIDNGYSSDIYAKIQVISFPEGYGSNLQLCINPICVSNLLVGNSYPSDGSYIPANSSNGDFDHFLNTNTGDGQTNLDYVFRVYSENQDSIEFGNSITFTYRYSPTLSNSDFNQLASAGIQLKSTVIKNNVDLKVIKPVVANIYDLNGKLIVNQSLVAGDNSIEASKLASGLYLLSLTNNEGEKVTVKIVKE